MLLCTQQLGLHVCAHLDSLRALCRLAEYIGCFKMRDNADNRLRLQTHRWYDPHYRLLEGDSSMYAEGPFYVVHGDIIEGIVQSGLTVRMGGPNEGDPSRLCLPFCVFLM